VGCQPPGARLFLLCGRARPALGRQAAHHTNRQDRRLFWLQLSVLRLWLRLPVLRLRLRVPRFLVRLLRLVWLPIRLSTFCRTPRLRVGSWCAAFLALKGGLASLKQRWLILDFPPTSSLVRPVLSAVHDVADPHLSGATRLRQAHL